MVFYVLLSWHGQLCEGFVMLGLLWCASGTRTVVAGYDTYSGTVHDLTSYYNKRDTKATIFVSHISDHHCYI
jgi:hypothetical protein